MPILLVFTDELYRSRYVNPESRIQVFRDNQPKGNGFITLLIIMR